MQQNSYIATTTAITTTTPRCASGRVVRLVTSSSMAMWCLSMEAPWYAELEIWVSRSRALFFFSFFHVATDKKHKQRTQGPTDRKRARSGYKKTSVLFAAIYCTGGISMPLGPVYQFWTPRDCCSVINWLPFSWNTHTCGMLIEQDRTRICRQYRSHLWSIPWGHAID